LGRRSGPHRVRGWTFALCVSVIALGCAKTADDQTGTGGTGVDAQGGSGGVAGDDGGAGNGLSDLSIFGDGPASSTCGNGVIEFGENCEDGNTTSGDGCSSACVIESHYTCPQIGMPCVHDVICGDHMIEGKEECDDGNTTSGDGCAADCKLECGWQCPPGAVCRAAKCGDGKVAGNEQCDDGNTIAGDGCSADCTLESRPTSVPEGWTCTSLAGAMGCVGPTTCATTVCGNGKKEGSEQCDDGNTVMGDGCSPFCRLEPVCPPMGGPCATVCGSGLLLPGDVKQCDDGNTISGDGCSADCKIEPGYECTTDTPVKPNPLVLPIVYHDFKGWNEVGGHPDFERLTGQGDPGMVLPMLVTGTTNAGLPVHVNTCRSLSTNLCAPPANANPKWDPTVDWFGMWYVDNATYNKTIVQTLTLGGQVAGMNSPPPPAATACNTGTNPDCTSFQFDSGAGFFPLDGKGWGNAPNSHNFGFTSEVRYWFEYDGAATLDFTGDDDVFVYINQILAVDMSGLHSRTEGTITLDAANGTGYACDFVAPGPNVGGCNLMTKTGGRIVMLGLTLHKVYEIAVFQAERHTPESNYRLTLTNFTGVQSTCKGKCGDGVVAPPEMCDLGAAMNTGAYGGCNADCTLAPFCGDKIVNGPEECDGTADCDAACKKIVVK